MKEGVNGGGGVAGDARSLSRVREECKYGRVRAGGRVAYRGGTAVCHLKNMCACHVYERAYMSVHRCMRA